MKKILGYAMIVLSFVFPTVGLVSWMFSMSPEIAIKTLIATGLTFLGIAIVFGLVVGGVHLSQK